MAEETANGSASVRRIPAVSDAAKRIPRESTAGLSGNAEGAGGTA